MPRVARLVVPGVALHLVQRGHNRGPCFLRDGDYFRYLDYLPKFAGQFGCSVHAYCLMTNHVHLLLTPHQMQACARMMKQLNQCYAQRVNKAAGRSGSLWSGRFHSCLVDSPAYALACYRYIELNPVRAGMVAHARDYPWSSYSGNAADRPDPLLVDHVAFRALGDCPSSRRAAYGRLVDTGLEDNALAEIRRATRTGQRLGAPLRPRGRPKRPGLVSSLQPG